MRDRLRSQGRFLAVREEFLDPAAVPPGTPITIVGVVRGSITKSLDESEYTYPVIDVKHLIDRNAVTERRPEYGGAPFYGLYSPPYGYYFPYWWGPYPFVIHPRPVQRSPSPPPKNIPPRFRPR